MQSLATILGSAPDATQAAMWEFPPDTQLIAVNNAWQIRPDWDYLVHAGDFPADKLPKEIKHNQAVHSYQSYVPAQNRFGGFVYAGGTMAFTAGYWALDALKPDVLAWFGCDMIYGGRQSHFYGKGEADPLRDDVTLQSLEAKSARLMALAARQGCICVNLSKQPESRLLFPRCDIDALSQQFPDPTINEQAVEVALRAEADLGYMVENGEYWKHLELFDADALAGIDALWLETVQTD